MEKEEKTGWMILAEKSMKKLWDNDEDDQIWVRFLSDEQIIGND